MKIKKTNPFYLIIAFMALLLATLAIVRVNNITNSVVLSPSINALNINGFLLPKRLPLANIKFTSTNGSLESTDNFEGQWTLLAVGYTQCPDVCPTTLLKLNQVIDEIAIEERPKVALLTIDITPDNINKLHDYMGYFNKDFIGLSTSTEQLDEFFQGLGASYSIKKRANGRVDIDHSTSVYLISPDKRYVANFPYMLTAEQMKQDYLAITRNE